MSSAPVQPGAPSPDNEAQGAFAPGVFTPLGLTHEQFAAAWRAARYPGGADAGRRAYSAFYREGDLAELPEPIREATRGLLAPIVRTHSEPCDEGVTIKFCQRLARDAALPAAGPKVEVGPHSRTRAADTLPLGILHQDDRVEHLDIESVVIPMVGRTNRKTHTLCVSSQVGCAMGCDFCETAQMGLIRSLTAAEIVGQWWAATWLLESAASAAEGELLESAATSPVGSDHDTKRLINNIVFMGMGEPLDNLDAVLQAIACLTDDRGPAVPMSNTMISTVGRVDGLRRLVDVVQRPGWKRLGLALSVNAPNDEVRDALMPVNRKWDMAELQQVMQDLVRVRGGRKILFEYVLIPTVNDSDEHADQLAAWLAPFIRNEHHGHIGLLNVIPYNPRRNSPWPAPAESKVTHFVDRLRATGVFVKRRRTKGRDQMAACGQLGTAEIRKRRFTPTTSV